MSRRHLCVLLVFLLGTSSMIFPQIQQARTAVIPFSAKNASKGDAEALTPIFETALVKTGVFMVIEQTQVEEILVAQERSLSDCTDERCAVEFGKLLAAEQIILGTLASVGGKYVLSAKVINVEKGVNIRAESVEVENVSKLTSAANLLAYSLAGLTYTEKGSQTISTRFSEFFVQTDPAGADVYVNGVKKGVSPLVVPMVPFGSVTVEARKGNYYKKEIVTVSSEKLQRLSLTLLLSEGNLFIRSGVTDGIKAYLSGDYLGELRSGLFERLPVGDGMLVLDGNGYYWEGNVTIRSDRTETVEVSPKAVGIFMYALPYGAVGFMTVSEQKRELRGSGTIRNIPTGTYTVNVQAENRDPLTRSIVISKGGTVNFTPELSFSREYLEKTERARLTELLKGVSNLRNGTAKVTGNDIDSARNVLSSIRRSEYRFSDLDSEAVELVTLLERRKAEADEAEAFDGFEKRIDSLSVLAQSGGRVMKAEADAAVVLTEEIRGSGYDFRELAVRAGVLVKVLKESEAKWVARDRMNLLETEKGRLAVELENRKRNSGAFHAGSWISIGCGIVALAGAGVSFFLGSESMNKYKTAATSDDAGKYRNDVKLYADIMLAGAGGGAGGLALGLILGLVAPDTRSIEERMASIDLELLSLQEASK